jgi:hypothetical protein
MEEEIMRRAASPDPWTPSGKDYDRSIHSNPDAAAWADFFVATFPGLADKRDTMLGWFANAMMAMHDSVKAAAPSSGNDKLWRLRETLGGDKAHLRSIQVGTILEWIDRLLAEPSEPAAADGQSELSRLRARDPYSDPN